MPPVFYKFTDSRYVWGMLNMGVFRIGTLYDYRRVERYPEPIGDSGEGKTVVEDTVVRRTFATGKDFESTSWVLRQSFGIEAGATNFTFENSGASTSIEMRDHFLYCFSEAPTRAAAGGYDACVEIRNPPRFIELLSRASGLVCGVGGPYAPFGFEKCIYAERRSKPSTYRADVQRAILLKPPRFQHQREWRCIWSFGSRSPIEPLKVMCPEAGLLCRRVEIS